MGKTILIIVTLIIAGLIFFFTVIDHFSLSMLPTAFNGYKQGDRPFQISGHAMEPSYKAGQYWLGTPYTSTEQPQRGDVVIFKNPKDPSQEYDKRIVGLPNEKIMLKAGLVYINGQPLQEPYLTPEAQSLPEEFQAEGQELTIPSDNYYVMGDNRQSSSDSRSFGFVPRQNILFKLTTCYKGC